MTPPDDETPSVNELLVWLYEFTPESPVPQDFVWRIVRLVRRANDEALLDPLGGPHPRLEGRIRAAVVELNRLVALASEQGMEPRLELEYHASDEQLHSAGVRIRGWAYREPH